MRSAGARVSMYIYIYIYQWRRKVPKSVGGGGHTDTYLCTFGKEPI